MTAPATGTALLILVGFVLPGFVAVLLKERLYEVRGEESTFDRLLTTVYYSLLATVVVLVLPTLAAVGAWTWMNSAWRRRIYAWSGRLNVEHRTQTSWDFAFNHEQDLLLVVELKDGSRVAGYYGERSHSGYGTRTRDLFLEERWDISSDDGSISRPPAERHSVGVWIDADEIRLVDHYAMSNEHQRDIEQRSPERA